ncbi:MAG: 5'-3' exonuclease H3TH domain-containing protein [Planctomycetota bacterium]
MTWLLIDGNNWFAQCFYASPEHAEGNFDRRLATLRNQVAHSRCVVCWDSPRSWRCDLSPSYKAHRDSKPATFGDRLIETKKRVACIDGVDSFQVETFEADDLIATLVCDASHEGEKAILFSADADLHQLLCEGSVTQVTKVQRDTPNHLVFTTISAARLHEKYGVHPWQWIDYRCLVGDSSDGIRGVQNVGPKAASQILSSCTLDEFVENPWRANVKPKVQSNILNDRESFNQRRRLLTLVSNVPLPSPAGESR